MLDFIAANEPAIRMAVFFGVLGSMALWEILLPRRPQHFKRRLRWPNNLGIVVLNTVVLRLTFPIVSVGMAVMAEERGWGVFNLIEIPGWLALGASILILDLVIYVQHVVFHAVPILWRLHRMHHADLEFDVTTGLRFHPIEILLSMVIKLGVVVALGPPVVAVLIFEIMLNGAAMFNHGNVSLPPKIDRVVRWFIVTPDMHRVHHSIRREETNSNYGFSVPWWDRLFKTYRATPVEGHDGMTIGIEDFRTASDLRLYKMLLQPFRKENSDE